MSHNSWVTHTGDKGGWEKKKRKPKRSSEGSSTERGFQQNAGEREGGPGGGGGRKGVTGHPKLGREKKKNRPRGWGSRDSPKGHKEKKEGDEEPDRMGSPSKMFWGRGKKGGALKAEGDAQESGSSAVESKKRRREHGKIEPRKSRDTWSGVHDCRASGFNLPTALRGRQTGEKVLYARNQTKNRKKCGKTSGGKKRKCRVEQNIDPDNRALARKHRGKQRGG